MIAIDTNILVYAHREDSSFHEKADKILTELAESGDDWTIPWPCIHEFYAVVTHPKIYLPPTPLDKAVAQIDCWMECPSLKLIGEKYDYWQVLKPVLISGKIQGARVHDARIAAICIENNIKVLWSADRDFNRIQGLKIKNPLL